jgi:hypothetical protein
LYSEDMNAKTNHYVVKNPSTGKLETICLETGEVISDHQVDVSRYRFNIDTALLICQKVREGQTLKSIACEPDLPDLAIIHYWQRSNPQFSEEIKLARQERAEYYHDRVVQLADEVVDKDEVPVARFKADTYKWAAEKGNPERYGQKTQVSGSIENKVSMIVLNTGIKRAKPDVEVEVTKKEEIETDIEDSE